MKLPYSNKSESINQSINPSATNDFPVSKCATIILTKKTVCLQMASMELYRTYVFFASSQMTVYTNSSFKQFFVQLGHTNASAIPNALYIPRRDYIERVF